MCNLFVHIKAFGLYTVFGKITRSDWKFYGYILDFPLYPDVDLVYPEFAFSIFLCTFSIETAVTEMKKIYVDH